MLPRRRLLGGSLHEGIGLNFATGQYYVREQGRPANVQPLTSLFTFTGGNQSMYMGPSRLLVQSVTNTPRIEYDANGNCLGLLMEAARTNLALQSQTFDNASWTKSNSSVTANTQTAPDGTLTADTLVENGASAQHLCQQFNVTGLTAATVYCVSVFVKAGTRTRGRLIFIDSLQTDGVGVAFDLTAGTATPVTSFGAGTLTASGIIPYPNGWFRVWVAGAMNNAKTTGGFYLNLRDAIGQDAYLGDTVSGFHIWGAQHEAGAFPSSYIPTTTVSVARTADSCIRTLGSEFSATAGTMFALGDTSDPTGTIVPCQIDDATFNNRLLIYRVGGAQMRTTAVTGGAGQSDLGAGPTITTGPFKAVTAWTTNSHQIASSGSLGTEDTSITVPAVTQMHVGNQLFGAAPIWGHILRFDYWPARLPNTYLVSASS